MVKGDPLYIVGYQLGQAVNIVAKADSSDVAKMPVVGLADDDYANQAFGTMTAFGSFNGAFDTTGGTESWAIGDIIFVKPGGGLTNIKPGGTDLIQNVAIVSRVNSQTGELEVIALGRTNDVPNLPTGRLFVGTAANTSLTSDVVYVDDANDRVGIGTTTPSTVLEVSSSGVNGVDISQSASNASQSGRLFFTTNTASEGFALFNSNGTFQVNSGGIPNNTSGTNRISIIGSSGNVGIGTTSPSARLDVVASGIGAEITSAQSKALILRGGSNSQNIQEWTTTSSSVLAVVNSNGYFGIGTTSPSYQLQVTGDSSSSPLLQVDDDGDAYLQIKPDASTIFKIGDIAGLGDTAVIVGSYGDLRFNNSGSTTMTVNNFNRVGIGTTAPSEKLVVRNGTASTDVKILAYNSAAGTEATLRFSTIASETNYEKAAIIARNAAGSFGRSDMHFALDSVADSGNVQFSDTKMTILNGGNVGIGTTSPSEKLEVAGSVKADNYINQRVAWNVGFLANSVNTSSYYYIPVGYISETTSNQYYNNWVASYAGRVRKIVMRNLGSGSAPTATTINFRITVNGTVTCNYNGERFKSNCYA